MTRSAARSPAAQRAMAAETCASIALSAGASVVIGCRPAGILREGPLRANVIPATAGAALWMQPAQLSFTRPSASVLGPLPYPDWSQSATAIPRESAMRSAKRTATTIRTIMAASAALLIGLAAAQAAEVAALSGDNTVSIVDTSKKAVIKTWKISGIAGKVLGFDVRPADNMLYAVGADGGIYTVDLASGKATMKSQVAKNEVAASGGDT